MAKMGRIWAHRVGRIIAQIRTSGARVDKMRALGFDALGVVSLCGCGISCACGVVFAPCGVSSFRGRCLCVWWRSLALLLRCVVALRCSSCTFPHSLRIGKIWVI